MVTGIGGSEQTPFLNWHVRLVRFCSLLYFIPLGFILFWFGNEVHGQGMGVSTPFTTASDSYFESTGINWGGSVRGGGNVFGLTPTGQLTPNIGFSWGAGGGPIPQFGGFNPGSVGQLGFGGPNFRFGMQFGKGSSRSLVSTTPSIMVPNGGGGSIMSGQFSPFVTGVVPTIGGGPVIDNAVTRALESGRLDLTGRRAEVDYSDRPLVHRSTSTAQRGDQSVAAIRAERAQARKARKMECDKVLAEAKALLEKDQKTESRAKFRKALELTDDEELKKLLRLKIEELRPIRKK